MDDDVAGRSSSPSTAPVTDFELPSAAALGLVICIDNDPPAAAAAGSLAITGEYGAGRGVDRATAAAAGGTLDAATAGRL